MIEIRSFRRVFDLERRIYSVDRLRLNPGGVPVRGVVYFLALLLAALIFGGLPLLGATVRATPWYGRDLLAPGATAAVLSIVRVDGRTFHLAAQALLRFGWERGLSIGLRGGTGEGERWIPQPITILPDGSDGVLRRLRYTGPGAVLILVEHHQAGASERERFHLRPGSKSVRIAPLGSGGPLSSGKVISLEGDTRLLVSAKQERARR